MKVSANDIFLDFETRSRAELKKVGAWRYCEDPSTKILCCSYAFGDLEPEIWIEGQQPPARLMEAIGRGYYVHGWNGMSFERAVFEVIAGPQLGWVTPRLDQYQDTMLDALALALPASLEDCGEAINCSVKKDKAGKLLIQRLCKPISAGKHKGEFREREVAIKEYASLYLYCKQDVRAEREIYKSLPRHVEGQERDIALLIAKINERGLPMDITTARTIEAAIEKEKEIMCLEFQEITGVNKPTERASFLTWLNSKGADLFDTQAETFRDYLTTPVVNPEVRKAIEIAQAVTKTSNAKYSSLLRSICRDNTIKNNLIYHKANTGRLAGAGFQMQNLPADCEDEPEPLIECFVDDNIEFIRLWKGVLQTASALVRSMIKARLGKKFLNGDLKGIEARGASYVAQEWDILKQLGEGLAIYKITAARMYHIPVESISKSSDEYKAGKISVLAGGFGGGPNAILNMAIKMGITMTESDAKTYSKDFRKGRPQLVKTWYAFGDAAISALENPRMLCPIEIKEDGHVINTDRRFIFQVKNNYLYLILPNGRHLSFPFPKIHEEFFKGRLRKNVKAMWVDSYTHKWSTRIITGANFFQSAVQGLCRDLLMEAHLRVEEAGFPLILSVHDEGMSEVDDTPNYTVAEYRKLMCVVPEWAKGFPIDADCWEGYRFKK